MRRHRHARSLLVAIVVLLAVPALAGAAPRPGASGTSHRPACPGAAAPGSARCHAQVVTDSSGTPLLTTGPSGYGPSDLQSAYALASASASQGAGRTVAIVDAYDDPSAESDLSTYRSQYGLPACTSSTGCFQKIDENGGTSYPVLNTGWAQEISLDLDMVSAICPNCRILLVEGASASFADLGTAVNTAAARTGTVAISNSYGGSEFSTEPSTETAYYRHPGIDVTVSSGDNGYGVQFPAASQYVEAVGGTTLTQQSGTARGWSETAWSGAGSGCSAYETKPTWQADAGCSRRTVADLSAEADPNTGVAVYDSLSGGWLVFGGTSVASPIVASVDALAGGRAGTASAPTYGAFPYQNPSLFWPVTSGSNGNCSGSYLCTAGPGYDGPTGMGTPDGIAAASSGPPTNSSPPSISGTTTVGQTLTANPGTWTGSPTGYTFVWQRCTPTCSPISTATASTYTLTSADQNASIDVVVTATNGSGSSAPATSSEVGPVQAAPAPDYTVSASPSSATMKRFGSTSYQTTVTPENGYSGTVSMSVSGVPAGVSASWSPSATASSTAGWTPVLHLTGNGPAPGTYTLTILGSDGTHSHQVTVTLQVTKH